MEECDVLDFIDPEEDPTESPEDHADREFEASQKELAGHLSEFTNDAF